MLSLSQNFGAEIPFILLLFAFMVLRFRVNPKTSLWFNTSPAKLWALIDVYDGKVENWGRTVIRSELIDATSQTFRKTYTTTQPNGTVRPFTALFAIGERANEHRIELNRADIDGKSKNNELLKITHTIIPEQNGARLTTVYNWGPRPLVAQLLARTDLWSGAWRLKGQAETGIPNERPYMLMSLSVALLTGLVTLAGFLFMFGPIFALSLLVVLFVHEFGHLLAFRILGQPWGRMVFLPFLGALAMPRLPFESQSQSVFSALMGPGFSVLLSILCAIPLMADAQVYPILGGLGVMSALINVFNLLPVEPLDGGIALRSILTKIIGKFAQIGLLVFGCVIALAGFVTGQIILVGFGGLSIFANLKARKSDAGLTALSTRHVWIWAFCYVAIIAAHVLVLRYLIQHGAILKS
jgi:Zn-dependent protease